MNGVGPGRWGVHMGGTIGPMGHVKLTFERKEEKFFLASYFLKKFLRI